MSLACLALQASPEDVDRMHALEEEIEDDKKALVDLEQSSDNLRKKAKKLESAIENVGGEPLKKQRELVSRLQNEISSAESEAAKKQALAMPEAAVPEATLISQRSFARATLTG